MSRELNPTEQAHKELQSAFSFLNRSLFDGLLPECLITLQRHRGIHGLFSPHRFIREDAATVHEIAINPQTFAMATLREVLSILGHEMCHLWAHVNSVQGRRGYHSSGWADQMEKIGLMPSSTGKPGGKRTGEKVSHYIVPDGPFFVASSELMSTGFNITWLDRVAAPWDMVDAEIKADLENERRPLGGALFGKVGLLVNSSTLEEGGETPDLSGAEPLSEHVAVSAGSGDGNEPESKAEGHASTEPETRMPGDPPSGQYRPTSLSIVDDLPPDSAGSTGTANQDSFFTESSSKPVILDTGSKARSGEKPVSIQLISVSGAHEPKKSRTDKVKFTCPTCGLNAWAKASAVLDCGTCKEPMASAQACKEAEPESAAA